MAEPSLEPGTELLHFRLVEKLGEGGMGVVWRAVDTSLGRDVAIKILPAAFAADAERLARFEREARLLASLNHPHIAAIYGVHDAGGVRFLSMELVAGEDVSVVLERGAMPVERALRVGREVAEALEAAHERGVIHRDLKPANVRLTREGRAKVLDFGLAKAADPVTPGDLSHSPTLTSAGTMAGAIMGTAAYMSPEQASGQPIDRRCDIWSFGVTLFEMLSGRRLFHGETVSHTLADVLRSDIDLTTLPAGVPVRVRRLLDRCLDRDPSRRLRDIGEARVALDEALEHPDEAGEPGPGTGPAGGRRAVVPWALAAGALVVAALAVGYALLSRDEAPPPPVGRFVMTVPNSGYSRQGDGRAIGISPDGRHVVTRGGAGSDDMLYVRALDDFEARPLEGTTGGRLPQFSPDSRFIAYLGSGGLMRVPVAGGAPASIGWFPSAPEGFDWAFDGAIYYAVEGRIWRLRLDGSEPEALTDNDPGAGLRLSDPELLPGGRSLVCNSQSAPGVPSALHVVDLATRAIRDLGVSGSDARYLPTGHLLFAQLDRAVLARFDPDELAVTDTPVPVLPRVWIDQGRMQLDVSRAGTVAYMPRRPGETQALVTVSRDGATEPLLDAGLPFASLNDPRISPDGTRLLVTVDTGAIWMVDLRSETPTLLSEAGFYPLWSPDGTDVMFTTSRNTTFDVMRLPVNLSVPETIVLDGEHNLRTMDWTRDGSIVIREEIPGKGMDLRHWLDPADPDSLEPLMDGPDDELAATVSPDGRWLAYVSNYSGVDEIYVTSFPRTGARTRVSNRGGNSPAWSPDGRELYYVEKTALVALTLDTTDDFRVTKREPLFDGEFVQYRWSRQYDVRPDGRGFVMIENPKRGDIEVVTGWFGEIEALGD